MPGQSEDRLTRERDSLNNIQGYWLFLPTSFTRHLTEAGLMLKVRAVLPLLIPCSVILSTLVPTAVCDAFDPICIAMLRKRKAIKYETRQIAIGS